jgi:hypothetical protein
MGRRAAGKRSPKEHEMWPLPEEVEGALKDVVSHIVDVHRTKIQAIAQDQEKKAKRMGLPDGADLGVVSEQKKNT